MPFYIRTDLLIVEKVGGDSTIRIPSLGNGVGDQTLGVDADGNLKIVTGGGGGTPGGSDTQVQFNDSGAFGGDAGFVFNKTTKEITNSALASGGTSPVPTGSTKIVRNDTLGKLVFGGVVDDDVPNGEIDYSKLKNTPSNNPGVYLSPAQSFDPSFVVFASAIVRPGVSAVHGDPIGWNILDHTTQHNSSFYEGVESNFASERMRLTFPTVKNVLNTTITLDESFAGAPISVGPTVGTFNLDVAGWYHRNMGIRLTGNGTTTWTKNGAFDANVLWDVAVDGGGYNSYFNVSAYVMDYDQIVIAYSGPNNYGIRRFYSPLYTYNAGFVVVDRATGLDVLVASLTSDDEITILTGGMQAVPLQLATWSVGNPASNAWFAGVGYNFWIFGAFECYMVAAPISNSSIKIRWQDYSAILPTITQYRIARSTSLGGVYTDIYIGLNLDFIDSGLTANTLYYYKIFVSDPGGEVELTYFRTNTTL